MDFMEARVNREVRKYDPRLYARRHPSGMIRVYRQADKFEAADARDEKEVLHKLNPQLILCLTDTWNIHGKPVNWGIEPVMAKIRQMDSHVRGDLYQKMVEQRETEERNKDRALRNNIRAIASDARRDFAKATNDINTSTLEKIDRRREKDGNCK